MAGDVKGVPESSSIVIPRLFCRNPASAIDFCARAFDEGATILRPAENQFWGDRIAWIMDPSGHVWTVGTRMEDTTARQRDDRWSEIVESEGAS